MAIDFDKSDDLITIANESSFDFERTDPFSISFVIQTNDTTVSQNPISKLNPTGNLEGWEIIYLATTGHIRFFLSNNFGASNRLIVDSDIGIIDTNSHHVTITYSGSSTAAGVNFYIDNVLAGNLILTDNLSASILNNKSVLIGQREGNVQPMGGILTEIAIWDVELNSQEVETLCNSFIKHMPLQIQPSNLVMYLPMDDGPDGESADGDTIRDLSGNGNDGTGDDGANNTGLTWKAEEILSYPATAFPVLPSLAIKIPLLARPPMFNGGLGGMTAGMN